MSSPSQIESAERARQLLSLALEAPPRGFRSDRRTAALLGLLSGIVLGLGLFVWLAPVASNGPGFRVEQMSDSSQPHPRPAVVVARCEVEARATTADAQLRAIRCAENALTEPRLWTHEERGPYLEALYARRARSAEQLWNESGAFRTLACSTALDWVTVSVRTGHKGHDAQVACQRACGEEWGPETAIGACRPARAVAVRTL